MRGPRRSTRKRSPSSASQTEDRPTPDLCTSSTLALVHWAKVALFLASTSAAAEVEVFSPLNIMCLLSNTVAFSPV